MAGSPDVPLAIDVENLSDARIALGFDPAFSRRRWALRAAADKRQQSAALQSGSVPPATRTSSEREKRAGNRDP
jgi:hypothetical protein